MRIYSTEFQETHTEEQKQIALNRLDAIRPVLDYKMTASAVALELGYSASTITTWRTAFLQGGIDALVPSPVKRPKPPPDPQTARQILSGAGTSEERIRSALQRLAIITPYLERRSTLIALSQACDIPTSTLSTWSAAYKKSGVLGLVPRA